MAKPAELKAPAVSEQVQASLPSTPPPFLYKYRTFPTEGSPERGWLRRIFTHQEVYFASRTEFNDPFDCRVSVDFDGSDDEWSAEYLRIARKYCPELQRADHEKMAAEALARGGYQDPQSQQGFLEEMQAKADSLAIFCTSSRRDSLSMWGRYADGHRGFCLEFNHLVGLFPALGPTGCGLEVQYRSTMPRVRLLEQDKIKRVEVILLSKSSEWADECEHRFVDMEGEKGVRQFRPDGLTGVIFGCKMPEEHRQAVREWIAMGQTRPTLYEAVMRDGEYALEIRPLAS